MDLRLKRIAGLVFLGILPLTSAAQMTVDATFTITPGTTVSTGHEVIITGKLINNGTLGTSSDLFSTGSYNGSGELKLSGTDQSVDLPDSVGTLRIMGGGVKTLPSSILVLDTLDLTDGIVSATSPITVDNGTIKNASSVSYVDGKLIRSGDTSLDYPVGSATLYTPVILESIDGTSPKIGVELVEADPAGTAGYGLLAVSNQRYWTISDENGAFDGAIITLPVRNETITTDLSALAVASGVASGAFTGHGAAATSGDLASGTVTSAGKVPESDVALGWSFNEQLRVADSLALIAIYNATGGVGWTDNTGWTTVDLDIWHGVTVQRKRPVSVDLSSNLLSGAFPEITSGLDSLKVLRLNNNLLTDVPNLTGLGALSELSIENNQLGFAPIENNLGIENFTYVPQDSLLEVVETIEEKGTVYAFDRTVSGLANQYSWLKKNLDGAEISLTETAAVFDLPVEEFAQEGYYYAHVTNSNVPDLTLLTRPVLLKVSSLQRDSLSLLEIYNSMGGNSWAQGADWPTTSMDLWEGITIDEQRVKAVDLPSGNLIGALPKAILDIKGLQEVDISGNHISGLPDLSALPNITSFDLRNNNLEFDDLEPNMDVTGLLYDQQSAFGVAVNERLPAGSDFLLSQTAGGSQNQYQWYLVNPLEDTLAVAAGPDHLVQDIQYETMGTYYVEVTSDLVPGLTLKSKNKNLTATAAVRFTARDEHANEVNEGVGYLLAYTEKLGKPYDSAGVAEATAGGFIFDDVVLGDYIAAIEGPVGYLPTYYQRTDLWSEATVLNIRGSVDEVIHLVRDPSEPLDGFGKVLGTVEAEFASEDTDGRVMARRKVKKAGCSLRRRTSGSGGRENEEDVYVLVAYIQSNDEGQFEFVDIPAGDYRINIEYPGIPMDTASFVNFTIAEDNDLFVLEAYITESGIEVTRINELGVPRVDFFEGLKVFPVPADERLTISYTRTLAEDILVTLTDLNGREIIRHQVTRTSANSIELETSTLEGGIYFLRFTDGSGKSKALWSYKIVVRHN